MRGLLCTYVKLIFHLGLDYPCSLIFIPFDTKPLYIQNLYLIPRIPNNCLSKTKKTNSKYHNLKFVLLGAGDRNRTGTGFNSRRILSPVRLPVPPLRQIFLCLLPHCFFIVSSFVRYVNTFFEKIFLEINRECNLHFINIGAAKKVYLQPLLR